MNSPNSTSTPSETAKAAAEEIKDLLRTVECVDDWGDEILEIITRYLTPATAELHSLRTRVKELEEDKAYRSREMGVVWAMVQAISPWRESNDMNWSDEISCGLRALEERLAANESGQVRPDPLPPAEQPGQRCGGREMKTIWKFQLPIQRESEIKMPSFAQTIHTGLDAEGIPCVWAIVDPQNMQTDYKFWVFGTGHQMPDTANKFINSFVQGPFVWHVFTQ